MRGFSFLFVVGKWAGFRHNNMGSGLHRLVFGFFAIWVGFRDMDRLIGVLSDEADEYMDLKNKYKEKSRG